MEINRLNMKTNDITMQNIEKIKELFPNVITEKENDKGKTVKAIDFNILKQILSKDLVEDNQERYTLNWPGKKASILKANTPITKTLRPVVEDSVDFENTENLYLEGDNFEVLKILQESYLNKVKMIYIDPPYNTGKDFIYKDKFSVSQKEHDKNSGAIDEDGYKMFQNTNSNGRYHSDWLSMMYERLLVARDLLTDDGVIFMSIDDNEVHNLRKISDEIFGEENFVGEFIKQSKVGGGSDSIHIAKEHEYILLFSKNIEIFPEMFETHDEKYLKRYKFEDEFGRYFWDTLARPGLKNPINYDIIAPDGSIINGNWIYSKKRFDKECSSNNIQIKKKKTGGWSVQFKQRLNLKGKKPRSMTSDFGGTIEGKKEISTLFEIEKIFPYPKSIKHIKKILEIIISKNDIILDFFSGSATTAHAVMQLNAEDGGNRKFIMVQLPEKTAEKKEAFKAGYENICEIGKERIRRAGKKIKSDFIEKYNKELEKLGKNKKTLIQDEEMEKKIKIIEEKIEKINNLDIGFRVYKTDETNMKEVFYHPLKFNQKSLDDFTKNIKDGRTSEDLLTQVILDLGLKLSLPIEKKIIKENEVFFVRTNSLVACFDENMNFSIIDEIAKVKPLKVVFKNASFKNDADLINLETKFKELSPDTQITVL